MEWEEITIDICCDLIAGYAFKSKDFGEFDTKVIRIGDITPPFVHHDSAIGVNLANYDHRKIERYKIKYNDFVLAMTGATIGKVGRYISDVPSYVNQRVLLFKSKEGYDHSFIYYTINSYVFSQYVLNHIDSESAQPNISANTISKFSFKIPANISDQRKIAGILSALDSKIENNNKINANLEAQAEALFKSWFVDFTPFKDQPFVDSELGPIPQGWKVGTLGDIANIIMGQSPAGSSYNERGNGVIFYQGRTEFGFRFPNVRLYTTMPKRYAEPMSILLSVRAPVGDINVAIEKCCIGRGLASISSKRGLHSFLLYLVKSLKNRLEVFNGEGTVFGSINKNTLMQFKIIIPPIEMQEKFNEIIQRHDCMVLELHKEIINLSTQRDTLLPKLMSGEIKL